MKEKYSNPQILLHWLSALIIIWATLSGFYVALFQPAQPVKDWVGFFNVSLTTVFIPFFLLRVWYALRHGRPRETQLNAREQKLAHLGHLALYANISVVMVTGVLMMDRDINVFNVLTLPQPLTGTEAISGFRQLHIYACVSLSLLVVGHVLAVLKHRLAGKKILTRMLP